MDYSGYSNYGWDTEVVYHSKDTTTGDEADRGATSNPDSLFDLLSFFATALNRDADEQAKWTTLVFFSIHLGPWNTFQPWKVYSGTSFSVTLLPRKSLIRRTVVNLDDFCSVRPLLAVKTPKLEKDNASHNSKLLRSLAKEYQILKTGPLAKHQNIVTAYGCIWQTLPTEHSQPTPALILEGTKFGDLLNFSRSRSLTLRERLKICIDVTSGLDVLHTHGVIHGDLKPNNILMFKSWDQGYTAKVADFGSVLLLSETTFPCPPPIGTTIYRAPECKLESLMLGRDDLVKTDLFSLGITLAFLLVGSHVVDHIIAMSASDLQSLKEDNKFAAWIATPREDDSTPIAMHTESTDWVTDLSWNENSVFADYGVLCGYRCLCDGLLAADAHERPESVKIPATVLRHMLRRHLQTLLPRSSEAASTEDGFVSSPAAGARLASLMRMSKARFRKLTGHRVLPKTRISKEEITAISHCCHLPGSYLKEAKFIIERNTGELPKLKRRSKKWRTKRALSKSQGQRTVIPAAIVALAKKMVGFVDESIDGEVRQLMDLKIVSMRKTVFKPSQESNIFWMLPHPVVELLADQLLQHATDPVNSDTDRADAAYEYAVVVFNSKAPDDAEIDTALELLTFAARNGKVEAKASVGRLSDAFGRPLAASQGEELEWLLDASRAGSPTAQRRFRDLDPESFVTSMREIRQENGATCPMLNKALLLESRRVQQFGGLPDTIYAYLHELAITGNICLLGHIPPEVSSFWYECENMLGETPLVVACRGGHTIVVQNLLARGANAAHETACGVSSLHFLAAFDDDDIPVIASALIQHGADVDKFCEPESKIYRELFDSPFGELGGTPLLWAVSAGNHCAVKALLARGADPLAMARHPRNFSHHTLKYSPITRAVIFHQVDLLKIIFDSLENDADLRKRFVSECVKVHGQGYQAFCLALDCHPGFRVREYVLHGREYQNMASSCVSLLLASGINPVRWIGQYEAGRRKEIVHPIVGACISSNTAILRYLWNYQNGILRPAPKLWVIALSHTVSEGLRTSFDFLIDRRDDIAADVDSDVTAIMKTLSQTNDPYFTIGILRLNQRPGMWLPPTEAFSIFFLAVNLNHFEVARQVQKTHRVSLTERRGGETIVWNLIAMSYDFPNMEPRVSFILSLSPREDTLFWNIGYLGDAGATALQCAVHIPTGKRPASPGVLDTVLERFSEPKYLNPQLKSHSRNEIAGYTALHLAVRCGNHHAVARLVQTPGIETSLRSHKGETPLDLCVDIALQYQMDMELTFQVDKARDNQTLVNINIFDLLLTAENEGRISKYATLLLRRTEDEYTLVDAMKGKQYGVRLQVDSGPKLSRASQRLVAETLIGNITAFSSDSLALPEDLKNFIDFHWKEKNKVNQVAERS